MTRRAFHILGWDGRGAAARQRVRQAVAPIARHLPLVIDSPDLAIWTSRPVARFAHTAGGSSLVIGEAQGSGLRSLDDDLPWTAPPGGQETAAREINAAIHGGYVAVIRGRAGLFLFADPSGALPFDLVAGDEAAVASDDLTPSLCRAIGVMPRPDWASLAMTLVAPASATYLSHLAGIRAAVPGRLHALDRAESDTVVWSPAQLARQVGEAPTERLRRAVDHAVAAIDPAACAMQLSGGLDSSIILATLARNTPAPPAITFATMAAGGDERAYATLAADACGARLIACHASRLPSYAPLFAHPPGAHPFAYGLDDVFEEAVATAAREAGRSRLVTGQGGDAVFFQPATSLVAVDRARALGLGRRALAPLIDDARRSRSTVWHHLLPALADRIRPAQVPGGFVVPELLTREARGLVGSALPPHPWLDDAADLPPGKRMHLTMLANCQIFHARRPDPDALPLHHPMLSQPVLEAVLPIPSYELVRGRHDRGLARAAFADRLPAAILTRRTKGDASEHYSGAALANLPLLREMLLDGVLVRERLIDRAVLERVLTRDHLFYSLDYQALVTHASCEAWARHWGGA